MGGAKNCPETPRQKMIGMMYLVLTAMLALNVSTDILKAFKLVDDSLHSSLEVTEKRNQEMMSEFRDARDMNPEKNGAWYDTAVELTQRSDSLYNFIQDFKLQLAILADGKKAADPEARTIKNNDNRDVTGQYAINAKHGSELKQLLIDYREYLSQLSEGKRTEEFERMFATEESQTKDGETISWEHSIFNDMPVGASIALLTKMQNDVRTAESEMIQYAIDQTDASDFRVNKVEAFVIPNSNYVIRGGKYTAKIVLAAIDSTAKPEYYVEGTKINDQGIYEVVAQGSGVKRYTGELLLPSPNGEEAQRIPFDGSYSVGEPTVSIANTDLNVMYSGYENKFSISVPGVSNDRIRVQVQGASALQRAGMWIINPSDAAKSVTISVSAEIDGRMQAMGSQTYKVRPKPSPGVWFTSGTTEVAQGKVSRNALLNPNARITASYGPDAMLNLKYTVTSFQMQTASGLTQSDGDKFSKQQLELLSRQSKGAMIGIVDVRVKDEKGNILKKPLNGILLTLN